MVCMYFNIPLACTSAVFIPAAFETNPPPVLMVTLQVKLSIVFKGVMERVLRYTEPLPEPTDGEMTT